MKKLLFLLLLLSLGAIADRKKEDSFGFHFKNKHQRFARLPFELHANLIVVKLRIDKSDTLRFVLDTGVSSNIITNPKTIEKLHLKSVRKVRVSGVGQEEELSANVSVGHLVELGEIRAAQQNVVFLDRDVLQLSEFLGIKIDGIFGYELFSNFVVNINFESRELTLTLPQYYKYKKSHGTRYPIVVTHSKPYTDALALVTNGQTKPVRLLIDTGAGHALLLGDVALPEKVVRANLGKGLSGDINGHIGRVQKIRVGNLEIENIVASFPDSISFSTKFPPSVAERQGSIGCELLRRFSATLNYREGYMVLKPLKRRMKESFEHDMSGLEIKAKGDKFKEYVVDTVLPNSPADVAGLEAGDELLFFNNVHIEELTMSDIYAALSKKEGKHIELFVRKKSGDLAFARFLLKRII